MRTTILAAIMVGSISSMSAPAAAESYCEWARNFVARYGEQTLLDIARLKYTEAQIAAFRARCARELKIKH